MRKLRAKIYRTKIKITNLIAVAAVISLIFLASTIPAYVYLIFGIFAFIGWCIWMTRNANKALKSYVNERGYVVLVKENDLEHRFLAKQLLNRELKPNEIVHHINGRRTDNAISNLCLMDKHKHELFHSWLSWKRKKSGKYPKFEDQKLILAQDYDGVLLEHITPVRSVEIQKPIENPAVFPPSEIYDANILFEELRKERLRIAREENIPAYEIFYDRTLHKLAKVMPDNDAIMIKMIGPRKYQKYGPKFLAVIKKFKKSNDHKKTNIG